MWSADLRVLCGEADDVAAYVGIARSPFHEHPPILVGAKQRHVHVWWGRPKHETNLLTYYPYLVAPHKAGLVKQV